MAVDPRLTDTSIDERFLMNSQNISRLTTREWLQQVMPGVRPQGIRAVDIGTGAGFPGIPIAVVRPECAVTLIESHQRKAVFLREATRDLLNVRVLAMRAEDVKEKFDWIVSRAVSPADVLKLDLAPNIALLTGHFEAKVFHVEH